MNSKGSIKAAVIVSLGLLALSLTYVGAATSTRAAASNSIQTYANAAPRPQYYLGALANIGGSDLDEQPYVAEAADGTLEATFITHRWTNNHPDQVAYARSTDHGQTWSQPEQISQSTGDSYVAGPPTLVNVAGVTHLLYSTAATNGGHSSLWYTRRTGGSWSTPTIIVPNQNYANSAVQIGSTSAGLYVMLRGDYNAKPQLATSSDGGNTWSGATNINTFSVGNHGMGLTQSGDNLYLAYTDGFGDGTYIYGRYLAAAGWQAAENGIVSGLQGEYNPFPAILGNTIYVSFCGWNQQNGDNYQNLYIVSRPIASPNSWSAPQQLTQLPTDQTCAGTNLVPDPATGQLLLTYQVTTIVGSTAYDNLYQMAGLPGSFSAASQLTSFGGQVQITSYNVVSTSTGLALALGYSDYPNAHYRAYYAPLIADGQPTPTAAPPSPTPTDCPDPFVDTQGNIFYAAIHSLYCQGVVNGTDAYHYSPAGTSTRGQFAKLVVLGFGLPLYTPTTGPDFSDVPPGYYAYTYIETGYRLGVLSGFDQASCQAAGQPYPCYLPNLPITRGQLTKLVVNAGSYALLTPPGGDQDFSDVPPANVFYTSIETAYHNRILSGYPDHTFRPNANIRRDEMAQIVYEGIANRPQPHTAGE